MKACLKLKYFFIACAGFALAVCLPFLIRQSEPNSPTDDLIELKNAGVITFGAPMIDEKELIRQMSTQLEANGMDARAADLPIEGIESQPRTEQFWVPQQQK